MAHTYTHKTTEKQAENLIKYFAIFFINYIRNHDFFRPSNINSWCDYIIPPNSVGLLLLLSLDSTDI